MKRALVFMSSAVFAAAAFAQEPDASLDALSTQPEGPSELDILSEGAISDFPDIDHVTRRKPVSVTLRALNKITAKYADIEIDMNAMGKYGALEITPRYCDKRPPEEFPETTAFVEIVDKSRKLKSDFKAAPAAELREEPMHVEAESGADVAVGTPKLPENMIFSGWMFASSPALNGVEHPVYDVWVIDCKTVAVDN